MYNYTHHAKKMVLEQARARCLPVEKPSCRKPHILLQNINLLSHCGDNLLHAFFQYEFNYQPPFFKALYKTFGGKNA